MGKPGAHYEHPVSSRIVAGNFDPGPGKVALGQRTSPRALTGANFDQQRAARAQPARCHGQQSLENGQSVRATVKRLARLVAGDFRCDSV